MEDSDLATIALAMNGKTPGTTDTTGTTGTTGTTSGTATPVQLAPPTIQTNEPKLDSGVIASTSDFKQSLIKTLKEFKPNEKNERDKIIDVLKKIFIHKTNTFTIKEVKYYKDSEYVINDKNNKKITDNVIGDAILTYYEYSQVKIKTTVGDKILNIQIKGHISHDKPILFKAGANNYKMVKKYSKITINPGTVTPTSNQSQTTDDEALALSMVALNT